MLLNIIESLINCVKYGAASDIVRPLIRNLSFSQYGEDLSVYRTFNVPKNAFYVDVGAAYPIKQSNTYRFYLAGGSGITIEPNPQLAALHKKIRPRDNCIQVGIAPSPGTMTYYRFNPADYNTFSSDLAASLRIRGIKEEAPLEINVLPLDEILAENIHGKEIDLMSIDCEGLDLSVAQSSNWDKFRPKCLLIEDHQPSIIDVVSSPITLFMKEKNYILVNRYSYTSAFLSKEEHFRLYRY